MRKENKETLPGIEELVKRNKGVSSRKCEIQRVTCKKKKKKKKKERKKKKSNIKEKMIKKGIC